MSSIVPSALVIEPQGGLCNRMRALDSAIAFSKETGRDLYVVWTCNPDLNCRFEELFLVPKCFKRLIQIDFEKNLEVLGYRSIRKLFSASGRFLDGVTNWVGFHETFRSRFANKKGPLYVQTFRRLPYGSRRFADFQLTGPIQRKIDFHVGSFDNVVGVHIRRTDNVKSIEYSPTSGFIECMRREVDGDNTVRFFLATDSPEVEQQMKETFSTRIITHPKMSLDRNNPVAIQDALVDLYCLSRTRKFIGSYWSSFSDAVREIGQMETIVVRKSAESRETA